MFTKRFQIGSVLGFPIYLDLSWFAILILISWSLATGVFPHQIEGLTKLAYWSMGFAGAIGLFASVLAHELGHAVIARRFGLHMRGITLFIFGGVAEMSEEPPSAKSEFYVAIAGPIVSIGIAVACLALGAVGERFLPSSFTAVIWYLGIINSALVLFNMVPAFPLDGGRVLRSILWHTKGSLKWATKVSSSLGSGFGMVLILIGLMNLLAGNVIGALWQFLIGMFVRNAAQGSYQQVLVRRALEGEPVSRFMQPHVVTVDPSMNVNEFVEDYVYRLHHKMFPVTDNGRLLGCVTTRDVQQVPRHEWSTTAVGDISRECEEENTIAPSSEAMRALTTMSQAGVSRMMVVEKDQLVGLLSLRDLMKFIALKIELEDNDGPHIASPPQQERTSETS